MSTRAVIGTVVGCLAFVAFMGWLIPTYSVWEKGMKGEANLRQAEQEKLILIETARAEMESAKLRAEAIMTIGEVAKKYPEYRQQEFLGAFGEAIQSGQVEQIILRPH